MYAERLKHCHLYIAHGTKCSLVTSGDGRIVEATDVPSLKCSREEADTRLLLHAAHAERCEYEPIVIQSPDTDVAVIACTLSCHFKASLYFRTGTKARTRIVDINTIRKDLGDDLSDCLIGLHALTGCDSTSAHKRRGGKLHFLLSTKILMTSSTKILHASEYNFKLPAICLQHVRHLFADYMDLIAPA